MLWEETHVVPNPTNSSSLLGPRTLYMLHVVDTSDLTLPGGKSHLQTMNQPVSCYVLETLATLLFIHYHFHLCVRSKTLKQVGKAVECSLV